MALPHTSRSTRRRLFEQSWFQYAFAVACVALAAVARRLLLSHGETGAAFVLLIFAVLMTSLVAGYRAGILAIILASIASTEDFVALSQERPIEAISQVVLFALVSGGIVTASYGRTRAMLDLVELKRIDDQRKVFVALVENANDFIGIVDPHGTPVYLNAAGRRMIGMPENYPIENTTIPEYYIEEQRAFARDVIIESVLDQGRWRGETYYRNWETGEPIPVSDEHFKILDETGRRVLGFGNITRDISESRRIAHEREELLERERKARRDSEASNAQLRESEERFRLMMDEAPIGMALVALDGRFVRVNEALCDLVGYPAEELEQLRFHDITYPADLDGDLVEANRLVRGDIDRLRLEKRYIRKDGSLVTVLLHTAILHSPGGTPLYYISQIVDITDRKRFEEQLRFSEARFSGIISISSEGIVSIDESQRITLFNDGAEKIFGYTRAEVLGAPIETLIPERYHVRHREEVTEFMGSPDTVRPIAGRHAGIYGRRKNGEEFPVEAAISRLDLDHTITMTVVLRDVTEQRRIQREQRYLSEVGKILSGSLDYEKTLTTIGELVVQELANWCVIQLAPNQWSSRRLRVIPDDPRLHPIVDELERLQIDPTLPHVAKTVWETGKPRLLERVELHDLEQNAQSEEHLRLMHIIDPRSVMEVPLAIGGKIIGVLGFVLSSTDRRYTEKDIPFAMALADRAALAIENGRLYQAAVQAKQLRDQVLGVVAHDLRNPLTLIQLQTSSLEPPPGMRERRDPKPRQVILRATERMNRLIQDLLDISQLEAGQLNIVRAPLAPGDLLDEVVESERELANASGLDLELELEHDLPLIDGDHDRLSQVLENLIGNAIKFTPSGGTIRVHANRRGDAVLFSIADTGSGIPREYQAQIFDRFWQLKKGSRHGAGLGLPISRGIVEAHGGRLWVDSELGSGATFFFTIPIARRT